MTPIRVGSERRVEAPHPGPLIKRDYVDAMGLAVDQLAAHAGLDAGRLSAMFDGTASFDVDAAIRLSRALQLPAERIMRMQNRRDFAMARERHDGEAIDVFVPEDAAAFGEPFVSGRLARASDGGTDASLYFQQTLDIHRTEDKYAGMHALWRGDRLRVHDDDGHALWVGPVLTDFDGHVFLPFARTDTWLAWFAQGRAADLAFGDEHAAFFERMGAEGSRV